MVGINDYVMCFWRLVSVGLGGAGSIWRRAFGRGLWCIRGENGKWMCRGNGLGERGSVLFTNVLRIVDRGSGVEVNLWVALAQN